MGRTYHLRPEEIEDIAARGLLTLVSLKPDVRNAPWYVMQAVVNRCVEEWKAIRKHRVEYVPAFGGTDDEQEELPVPDTRVNVERDALREDLIERCLSICTSAERDIFTRYLGRDGHTAMTQGEIASSLGLSPQRVSQIFNAAKARMRETFSHKS